MTGPHAPLEMQPFAIWLVPATERAATLQALIDKVCQACRVQTFPPHITVFAGVYTQRDHIEQAMDRCIAGLGPLALDPSGYEYTDSFFKTIFVAFREDERVVKLSECLAAGLNRTQHYSLRLHLSLVYKVMSEAEKQDVIAGLDPVPGPILFDAVQLVHPGSTNSWADIDKWEIVRTRKLEG